MHDWKFKEKPWILWIWYLVSDLPYNACFDNTHSLIVISHHITHSSFILSVKHPYSSFFNFYEKNKSFLNILYKTYYDTTYHIWFKMKISLNIISDLLLNVYYLRQPCSEPYRLPNGILLSRGNNIRTVLSVSHRNLWSQSIPVCSGELHILHGWLLLRTGRIICPYCRVLWRILLHRWRWDCRTYISQCKL